MGVTEASPTARALRTLEMLHARPGVTAEELAERLGVSARAARRYIAILREAGIDVASARGRYGGYRLGRGTRLPPVLFTEAEGLELVMAVLNGAPSAALDDDAVGKALGKVIRALPPAISRRAELLRTYAAAAPDPGRHPADPAITSALVAASSAHQRVRIAYRTAPERDWETEVDPWSVVLWFGRWYLLCFAHHVQAVRTYRIDRVVRAERVTGTFTPPAGLDPIATLEDNFGSGWPLQARIVFQAPIEQVRPWFRPAMGHLADHPEGCVVIGSTSSAQMYANEFLARVPFPFRVEGGPELRLAVQELIDRLQGALAPRSAQAEPSNSPRSHLAVRNDPAGHHPQADDHAQ